MPPPKHGFGDAAAASTATAVAARVGVSMTSKCRSPPSEGWELWHPRRQERPGAVRQQGCVDAPLEVVRFVRTEGARDSQVEGSLTSATEIPERWEEGDTDEGEIAWLPVLVFRGPAR